MHVISRAKLIEAARAHPDAKVPLDAWFKLASSASWKNLVEVRRTFPSADPVGRLIVFNIGGNNYRLITKISYAIGTTSGTVFIRHVLTHAEYDKGGWKNDAWF